MSDAADLILYNARVLTMDPHHPTANMVAIKNDRILGLGEKDDPEVFRGIGSKLIDCQGMTVIPGFNDAHCHPLSFAATLLNVDCSPARVKSISDIQAAIREQAQLTPNGSWIRAAKYDEVTLTEKRPPTRWELDEAAPNHPLILIHYSGHHCILNSIALSIIGITKDTPDTEGGHIRKDPTNMEPTGLISGRNEHVARALPGLDPEQIEKGVRLASEAYISAGITSVTDTSWTNGLQHWQTLRRFVDNGTLLPRVSMLIGTEGLDDFQGHGITMSSGDNRLRIGGIKLALDESTGEPHPPQDAINDLALRAHMADYRICFHMSDVYTLQASLTALDSVLQWMPKEDHRHRLEHCPICPPELLPQLKASRAIVVSQPAFIYYLGQRFLDDVPAPQLSWFYTLNTFRREGVPIAFSSDSPFVHHDPLIGIYTATARRVENGNSFVSEEGISAHEALSLYTLGSAYASFEENVKGSIAPGKLADLAVLSADPTQVDPESIRDINVMMTIIGGAIVWEQ